MRGNAFRSNAHQLMMKLFNNKIIQNYEKKLENPRCNAFDLEQKMF
jgi:hypothetical protein